MNSNIKRIYAIAVLDSRGTPTPRVSIELDNGAVGVATVPSGASTGKHEAHELRDGGDFLGGKMVAKAVANVNGAINHEFVGRPLPSQAEFDERLIALDGTPNKENLGANALLGASMALAQATTLVRGVELFVYLRRIYEGTSDINHVFQMPRPMCNLINGGAHADNDDLDFQEFMAIPMPGTFKDYPTAIFSMAEISRVLKKDLRGRGFSTGMGDEGGFAPNIPSNAEVLEALDRAELGAKLSTEQVCHALDVASSEFCENGVYTIRETSYSASQMIDSLETLANNHRVISIEDGLDEDDWDGWKSMTERLGDRVQLVGDDLFVTNKVRLQRGIESGVANSILIKVNQIGTLTETLETMRMATEAGYSCVMSHRSGETEDTLIADLAVATNCGQIKTGGMNRAERTAKYNRLLVIYNLLDNHSKYTPEFKAV